jgi:FHS family L-fucose permease-like MFS transporter
VGVAIVVLVLAAIFLVSYVPDIKTEDEYHIEDKDAGTDVGTTAERQINRGLVYFLLLLNASVLAGVLVMILWVILTTAGTGESVIATTLWAVGGVAFAIAAIALVPVVRKISHHSIWSHPHFSGATLAQFLYVAAQAGIFSFFVNYMTSQVPAIPPSWSSFMNHLADNAGFMHPWLTDWFKTDGAGVFEISDKGASSLLSVAFICFFIGRSTGAALLRRIAAHKILCLYGFMNVIVTILIFCKLGWYSVVCVFLSFLFMSIMFPTIFALGIFGLGPRTKRASAYLVMAIMGGAMLPKLMGHVADLYGMSRGYIVPMFCFVLIAIYGFLWPRFSNATSLQGAVGDRGGASLPVQASE